MADESKTWTVVGTALYRGKTDMRFANGLAVDRFKVLEKHGATEIRLFDLPSPMTKEAATAWFKEQGDAIPEMKAKPASERAPRGGPGPGKPKREPVTVRPAPAGAKVMSPKRSNVDAYGTDWDQADKASAFEEAAKKLHATSLIAFLNWEDLSPASRNEFRENAEKMNNKKG